MFTGIYLQINPLVIAVTGRTLFKEEKQQEQHSSTCRTLIHCLPYSDIQNSPKVISLGGVVSICPTLNEIKIISVGCMCNLCNNRWQVFEIMTNIQFVHYVAFIIHLHLT